MNDHVRGIDLLHAITAFVQRDNAVSGLQGRLALGVHLGDETAWLAVMLDGKASTSLSGTEPIDVDVSLLLGEAEAVEMLEGESIRSDANMILTGDSALLGRFMERYLKKQSMLSLRARLNQQ